MKISCFHFCVNDPVRVSVASPSPPLSCFLFSSLLLLSMLPLGSKSITRYNSSIEHACSANIKVSCQSRFLATDVCGPLTPALYLIDDTSPIQDNMGKRTWASGEEDNP